MAGSREHGAACNCSRHAAQWHEAEKHAVRLASLRDLQASRDIDHKSAIVILRQHTQSADGSSNHGRDIPHGDPTYENRCAPRGVRSYAYPEHRSETQMCQPPSKTNMLTARSLGSAKLTKMRQIIPALTIIVCAATTALYSTGHAPISLPLFTACGFRGRV